MNLDIPFFSLKRQWANLKAEIEPGIHEVLTCQQYIGGKFVKDFEEKLSSYLKVKNVISCNSGTDALWLALKALSLKENEIVLTTNFSFISSCSEIIAHKAHPVFIDIDENSLNISSQKIEMWLKQNATNKDNKTFHIKTNLPITGILVVNIFGQCFEYEKVARIAKKWNLWIIEDAAQSMGAQIDGKMSGTLGDISTFSFYPTKNLGAYGDGGAACTNNPFLAERLKKLRNHGRATQYDYTEYGINSRLDAVQAAMLSKKLDFLDELNTKRQKLAQHYYKKLKNISFIKPPKEIFGYHTYNQFCIQLKDEEVRRKLIEYLSKNKIGSNIIYPKAFTQIEFLQTNPSLKNSCPISEKITSTILALPIWPELNFNEIDYICSNIKVFYETEQQTTLISKSIASRPSLNV